MSWKEEIKKEDDWEPDWKDKENYQNYLNQQHREMYETKEEDVISDNSKLHDALSSVESVGEEILSLITNLQNKDERIYDREGIHQPFLISRLKAILDDSDKAQKILEEGLRAK